MVVLHLDKRDRFTVDILPLTLFWVCEYYQGLYFANHYYKAIVTLAHIFSAV